MTKIAPSMLSCDFSKLGEEVERADHSGADWIHLDVMDGAFVPNITFGAPIIKCIRNRTEKPFDVHLMIQNPVRYVDAFADAGADLITVHTEADDDPCETIAKIKDRGCKAGIALNPGTPVLDIEKHLSKVDLVLVMTVNAGFGGQKFHPECLPKIRYVAKYKEECNPRLEISADGGIDSETGRRCVGAGASVLVAGSALFRLSNMADEIALWHKYGLDTE